MRSSWFSWKSWAVGAVCGLGALLVIGADSPNRTEPRFQLHVWSESGSNAQPGRHGAYRIDTISGEVYSMDPYGESIVAHRVEGLARN